MDRRKRGVYALYPGGRRMLRALRWTYVAMGILAAALTFYWRTMNIGAGILIILFAISGFVMAVHYSVIGVPPPEGMEPHKPIQGEGGTSVSVGIGKMHGQLAGSEARPVWAWAPFLLIVVTVCFDWLATLIFIAR
jgi:hypothetical protein